ncbi:hypothetical protein N9L68_00840 [bacterium]|nr:hypothetical protein [bacterium]
MAHAPQIIGGITASKRQTTKSIYRPRHRIIYIYIYVYDLDPIHVLHGGRSDLYALVCWLAEASWLALVDGAGMWLASRIDFLYELVFGRAETQATAFAEQRCHASLT